MDNRKKQRKFSPEFKLNVVLESYVNNISAAANRHDLHITQVRTWKRQLLENGVKAFVSKRKSLSAEQKKIDQLEKIIGRLTVQNELLKKTQELLN